MRFMAPAGYGKSRLQRGVLLTFLVYLSAHWLTNFLLFFYKMGFSYASVAEYYLGSEEKFLQPRSVMGLLEVTHFHLFSHGFLLLTLIHLLLLIPIKHRLKIWLTVSIIVPATADILSGWLIRFVHAGFAWLKLGAFFWFQGALMLAIILIWRHIIQVAKIKHPRG